MKYYLPSLLIINSLMLTGCQLPFLTTQPSSDPDASTQPATESGVGGESNSSSAASQESVVTEDQIYTVVPGDTLFEVAYKTTGDGNNWRKIAQSNELKNPNSLDVGQNIVVPKELLLTSTSGAQEEPVKAEVVPVLLDDTQSPEDIADLAVNDSLAPVEKNTSIIPSDTIIADQQPLGGWLIVTGTYYPREIKANPGFGTDILLLATPGTRLRYTDFMNGWYSVETDKGVGYLEFSYAKTE